MWGDISLWFGFHFPHDQWCWASFHVPFGHLDVFFGKTVCLRSSVHVLIDFFFVFLEKFSLPSINIYVRFLLIFCLIKMLVLNRSWLLYLNLFECRNLTSLSLYPLAPMCICVYVISVFTLYIYLGWMKKRMNDKKNTSSFLQIV